MMRTDRRPHAIRGQAGLQDQAFPRYRCPSPADKHIPSRVVPSSAEGLQGPLGLGVAGRGVGSAAALPRLQISTTKALCLVPMESTVILHLLSNTQCNGSLLLVPPIVQCTVRYAFYYVSLDAFFDSSIGKVYYKVPWTLQQTQLVMA